MSQTTMKFTTGISHSLQLHWRLLGVTMLLVLALGGGLWWAQGSGFVDQLLSNDSAALTTDSTLAPTTGQPAANVVQPARSETGAPPALAAPALPAQPANSTTAATLATTEQAASQSVASSNTTAATVVQSVVAVAGVQGSILWAEDGSLVATLDSGERMAATARTAASDWLLVTSNGTQGWVQAESVIIFDQRQLTVATVPAAVITASSQPDIPSTPVAPSSDENLSTASAAPVTTALLTAEEAAVTTVATTATSSTAPIATVATTGARLNVRSGPGTTYSITAHVDNGMTITIIGSSDDGAWLQIQLADEAATTGWVAAAYVTRNDGMTTPVVDGS